MKIKERERERYFSLISHLIDRIRFEKLCVCNCDEETEKLWKYIIFILDEARINVNNEKFFSISKIGKFVKDKEIEKECEELGIFWVQKEINQYFIVFCLEAFSEESILRNVVFSLDYEKFILKLSKHCELFEEFVNWLLNGCEFDENLEVIEIGDYTIERLIFDYNMHPLNAFDCFCDVFDDKDNYEKIIKEKLYIS